jgi:cell division protein FtsI/penicillin-binding protein 2
MTGVLLAVVTPTRVPPRKTPAKKAAQPSAKKKKSRPVARSRWSEPTYADSTAGDSVDGEDLVVRRAAVDALGSYNGTVVAVDPSSGRVLTMVNQKVALTSGFQPCSTVKVAVALAALTEGIIARSTQFRLSSRLRIDLTEALAHSNNPYFANLGVKLGYERFSYYARLFGLGEKAGLNVPGEQPGVFPDAPPKDGGMGMLTSFGTGISLTPLELAAFLSAISNGGTLYYLQYPRSQQEVEQFVPRVKRHLDIAQWIPDVKPGMMAAVEYGTARRAMYSPEAPICGKTGTCTGGTTHLGWFGSFNDFGQNKIVLVVLMTGGRGVSGPTAAEIAGGIYRQLYEKSYFARRPVFSPAMLLSR